MLLFKKIYSNIYIMVYLETNEWETFVRFPFRQNLSLNEHLSIMLGKLFVKY